MIKTVVIDDSAFMRSQISRILLSSGKIEVSGTAVNGKFGIEKVLKLKPHVVILDLEMPEFNGIDFLKERKSLHLDVPVIILSSHAKRSAKIALDALHLGASDFILKPLNAEDLAGRTKEQLLNMVFAFSKIRENYEITNTKSTTLTTLNRTVSEDFNTEEYLQEIKSIPEIKIVSIGISTGGPNALKQMLPLFPKDFPVPILVVQHMPEGFTAVLAENLNKVCNLQVKEAEDKDIVVPGRVFISPGNRHLTVENKRLSVIIKLDDGEPVNNHKPSVDVLFKSVAEVYEKNSIGCIMTGMGKDGAINIGEILKKGGITIAQDQQSSVIFGMPKQAICNHNINLVKSLDSIAETIINLVNNKKSRDEAPAI